MITAGLTNSFKEQLLLGQHDLETDTLKIALYTSSAVLGPGTLVYTTAAEVSGPGYVAGGEVLVNVSVNLSNGIAYASFDNPTWIAATFYPRRVDLQRIQGQQVDCCSKLWYRSDDVEPELSDPASPQQPRCSTDKDHLNGNRLYHQR